MAILWVTCKERTQPANCLSQTKLRELADLAIATAKQDKARAAAAKQQAPVDADAELIADYRREAVTRPWNHFESWTTACVEFRTPTGAVPCDLVNNGFAITTKVPNDDGSAQFGFAYFDSHDRTGGGVVFFKTRVPDVPDVYPIEEIISADLQQHTKTHGVCDMRGGYIHCVSGDPGEQFLITYRLISVTRKTCPPSSSLEPDEDFKSACKWTR